MKSVLAKAPFSSYCFRPINGTAMNLKQVSKFPVCFIAVWLQPTDKLEWLKGL